MSVHWTAVSNTIDIRNNLIVCGCVSSNEAPFEYSGVIFLLPLAFTINFIFTCYVWLSLCNFCLLIGVYGK